MTTTHQAEITIGSVFSGIGAMDLACERHFRARTAWFCEREAHPQKVLAARWPGVPIYDDVQTLADMGAEPVTCLIGGPPCVDLSYAGRRAGLTAERSGLFFDFIAVAARMDPQPRWVVIENVPALLSEYRGLVESELAACGAGYGVTWAKVAAAHVQGCPHLRKRVFVLAELGGKHKGVCDAGAVPAVPDAARWPTPNAGNFNDGQSWEVMAARAEKLAAKGMTVSVPIAMAVQPPPSRWPTPKATDTKNGGYQRDPAGKVWPTLSGAVGAASMPDDKAATRVERKKTRVERWPTPKATDTKNGSIVRSNRAPEAIAKAGAQLPEAAQPAERWPTPSGLAGGATSRGGARIEERLLGGAVQAAERWSTPCAADGDKDRGSFANPSIGRRMDIGKQVTLDMQVRGKLAPDWVEVLQGLPPGWTDPTCDREQIRWHAQHLMEQPRWPAPMVKGLWGDSPQHGWEPPRTAVGKLPNRSARIKALGNCLPPQQYLLALKLLAAGPKQSSIFDLLGA